MTLLDRYAALGRAATPGVIAINKADMKPDDAVTGSTVRVQDGVFYVEADARHESVIAVISAASALESVMASFWSYGGKRKALKDALAIWRK